MVENSIGGTELCARMRGIQYAIAALVLAALTIGFGLLPGGDTVAFLCGFASLGSLIGSFFVGGGRG